jgi:hypothetical protein
MTINQSKAWSIALAGSRAGEGAEERWVSVTVFPRKQIQVSSYKRQAQASSVFSLQIDA